MSRAAFEDLLSKGFIQPDAAFAGHSLGEFSALASIADICPTPISLTSCFIAV
jgi:malonyl CoA-acyl carrier protein transacylase